MAAITAQERIQPASAVQENAAGNESRADEDHGLARFFFAASAALILSAIQGVVQRLPGIADFLRDAD